VSGPWPVGQLGQTSWSLAATPSSPPLTPSLQQSEQAMRSRSMVIENCETRQPALYSVRPGFVYACQGTATSLLSSVSPSKETHSNALTARTFGAASRPLRTPAPSRIHSIRFSQLDFTRVPLPRRATSQLQLTGARRENPNTVACRTAPGFV
jgi:hypothetical protein